MTDHAREAAEKIMPNPSWYPDKEQDPECCYETQLAEKTAIIQAAIDAACAEMKRDADFGRFIFDSIGALHDAGTDRDDSKADLCNKFIDTWSKMRDRIEELEYDLRECRSARAGGERIRD